MIAVVIKKRGEDGSFRVIVFDERGQRMPQLEGEDTDKEVKKGIACATSEKTLFAKEFYSGERILVSREKWLQN